MSPSLVQLSVLNANIFPNHRATRRSVVDPDLIGQIMQCFGPQNLDFLRKKIPKPELG
jgi:hypothetical protein